MVLGLYSSGDGNLWLLGCKCRRRHLQESKSKHFPGEHAPCPITHLAGLLLGMDLQFYDNLATPLVCVLSWSGVDTWTILLSVISFLRNILILSFLLPSHLRFPPHCSKSSNHHNASRKSWKTLVRWGMWHPSSLYSIYSVVCSTGICMRLLLHCLIKPNELIQQITITRIQLALKHHHLICQHYSNDLCHVIRTMLRRNFQQRPSAQWVISLLFLICVCVLV